MARRSDDERPVADSAAPEADAAHDDGEERRHRLAAHAYFRAAPPYRIQSEEDGRFSLRKKRYDYWESEAPEAATRWAALSYHTDFEEAERRLRHVTAPRVYYDARGQLARTPREPEPDWGVPEDDD